MYGHCANDKRIKLASALDDNSRVYRLVNYANLKLATLDCQQLAIN